ncbi:MAG: hypothetical protein ACJAXA_001820 [Candidatus Aldehydirespiratoraceae bacterium]
MPEAVPLVANTMPPVIEHNVVLPEPGGPQSNNLVCPHREAGRVERDDLGVTHVVHLANIGHVEGRSKVTGESFWIFR